MGQTLGPLPLLLLTAVAVVSPNCRLSEFFCDTGQCVALDRFCDGADDCGDKSDEPRYCSPCNRTYYGDIGRTYELEIRRPREDRLPFLCHLNFTAAGGDLGDLVQLTFDTFTVGQFVSFTTEGCPDGHMTIRELGRPSTGGQWCGSAWGYTVYYSESTSLNLTLQLYRLSEQGIGYNFDFKLAYKFLKRSEAKLRYGNSTMTTWRGELVPGTYCDRVLDRCDIRSCRIQSPNFPGVYPRNVTCYYRVQQTQIPRGKHALLAVRQRNSHKIHIKDQVVKYDRSQRVLRVWDQCNVVQDYLTVYDGGSTLDPVLVRLCGGDVVPDIISSGPSMLLEFHTSPYDNPFHPVPLSYLPGFELEVQVLMVDLDSNSYVSRENRNCEFLLTSFDSTWGELGTPRHSLPPNSTCRYHFQGRRHETVWLSFVKYHADLATFEQPADTCNARLRIWDGRHGSASPALYQSGNVSLLGEFCKDEVPRLCDHSLLSNSTRHTRPCSLSESYVSSGSELTLELSLRQGSALYPVSFVLRYEFVDTALEGAPMSDSGCDRVFMSGSGRFQSPRSVFLFGRGGAANLSCVFRFVTSGRQSVRLTFTRARFGDRRCESRLDPRGTGRWRCEVPRYKPQPVAQLWVSEYPWPGVRLSRDCLCSSLTTEPMVITALTSSVVEVNFTVNFMNITEDFRHFFFEGEYQFLSSGVEDLCSASRDERRLRGSSGEIALRSPGFGASKKFITDTNAVITYEANDVKESVVTPAGISCVNHPWLIEPADSLNNYLYLKVRGYEVQKSGRCDTLNRILVYSGVDGREPLVVCPADLETMDYDTQQLEVFSDGWNRSRTELMPSPHARSFVVEFLEREPASYVVTWMEVSKRPLLGSSSSFVMSNSVPAECPYRCPELNACISSALWCDGSRHCPSGFDEDDVNCAASLLYHIPLLYVAIGAGALGVLGLLIALTAGSLKYRQYRRRTSKKTAAANHINHNGYSPATQHADMYGKDSLC